MSILHVSEDQVRELIDMPAAIDVVDEVFRQLATGNAYNVPRTRAAAPGIVLHTMSASAEYLGLVGWKAYTTTEQSARFHVAAYDIATGAMVALIEADYLGQLRTGAASGVATKYMAHADAITVGIFGSGLQARTQLQAMCAVRNIKYVEIYSRNEQRRDHFAQQMAADCKTDVVAVSQPDQAAAEKDIVICATSSKTPVFNGTVLTPGTHLNVIGSNFLAKAEVDVATVSRADLIVCDSIEQCKREAGDFVPALDQGIIGWERMHELSEIAAGSVHGRSSDDDITFFKSVGLAIEDVAMAAKIIELAHARH